ncbi:MAG: PQQ-binding-like beta-propeller repeat protein [Rubripirellula sp.]
MGLADWPQAAGPRGDFVVKGEAPIRFSVSLEENIRWAVPLPSTGQGAVIVSGDRLFLTSHEPINANSEMGSMILGMCFDAKSGKEHWRRELEGVRETDLSSLFSDNTAASPVASHDSVCFVNVGGSIQCFSHEGDLKWSDRWTPFGRHHSRQHEPILFDHNVIVARVTPDDLPVAVTTKAGAKPLGRGRKYWNHLRAYDMASGDLQWIAQAGTSVHSTSLLGKLSDGREAILTGRGGGHQPPEEPYGLSLVNARNGETIWERAIERYAAAQNASWNSELVCLFAGKEHLTLDAATGEPRSKVSLSDGVTITRLQDGSYRTKTDQQLPNVRKPITLQSNCLVGDYHYFRAHGDFLIGRVNVGSGDVEYLQVPALCERAVGKGDVVHWENPPKNDMKNADGFLATQDNRNAGSGWGHVSAASPIVVGQHLYMPTMLGMVYVVKWNADRLDESALIHVSDLGPAGETWSLSSLSYANGRLYARTLKQLICIGN